MESLENIGEKFWHYRRAKPVGKHLVRRYWWKITTTKKYYKQSTTSLIDYFLEIIRDNIHCLVSALVCQLLTSDLRFWTWMNQNQSIVLILKEIACVTTEQRGGDNKDKINITIKCKKSQIIIQRFWMRYIIARNKLFRNCTYWFKNWRKVSQKWVFWTKSPWTFWHSFILLRSHHGSWGI